MPPRVKQAGKVLASGVLFLCLGLGGLVLTVLACPFLWLAPPPVRRRGGTALVHHGFRFFVVSMEATGILHVVEEGIPGPEALRGALVIANHPSWLDVVVLLARLPGTACVVKPGVWRNPFFGPVVRTAGFLPAQDPESLLEAGAALLAEGRTLILFPEGSRSRPDGPLRFQRGAAHLALRAGAPVFPVLITVDPPLLGKGARWYHMPSCICRFHIQGRRPFSFAPPPEGQERAHLARQATETMQRFFNQELHGPDHHPA